MPKYCGNCGSQLDDYSNTCSKCGRNVYNNEIDENFTANNSSQNNFKIHTYSPQNSTKKKNYTKNIIIASSVILLFLLIIIAANNNSIKAVNLEAINEAKISESTTEVSVSESEIIVTEEEITANNSVSENTTPPTDEESVVTDTFYAADLDFYSVKSGPFIGGDGLAIFTSIDGTGLMDKYGNIIGIMTTESQWDNVCEGLLDMESASILNTDGSISTEHLGHGGLPNPLSLPCEDTYYNTESVDYLLTGAIGKIDIRSYGYAPLQAVKDVIGNNGNYVFSKLYYSVFVNSDYQLISDEKFHDCKIAYQSGEIAYSAKNEQNENILLTDNGEFIPLGTDIQHDNFVNGYAVVMNEEGKYGYINTSGKLVVNYNYDIALPATSSDSAWVKVGKKWYSIKI